MTGISNRQEISLGNDLDAVVRYGGTTVEMKSDGNITVYTNGDVKVRPAANDDANSKASTAPQVGTRMPDGSIYAGTSPDTRKPMYATAADAPLTYTFNQAQKYASKLDAHGHHDWRVPTKDELNVLFQNRASIGAFDISGSYPAGWYWSSSQDGNLNAWDQRFSVGYQYYNGKYNASSLRCVR